MLAAPNFGSDARLNQIMALNFADSVDAYIAQVQRQKREAKTQRKAQLAQLEAAAKARKEHRLKCVAKEKERRYQEAMKAEQHNAEVERLAQMLENQPSSSFDEATLFRQLRGDKN